MKVAFVLALFVVFAAAASKSSTTTTVSKTKTTDVLDKALSKWKKAGNLVDFTLALWNHDSVSNSQNWVESALHIATATSVVVCTSDGAGQSVVVSTVGCAGSDPKIMFRRDQVTYATYSCPGCSETMSESSGSGDGRPLFFEFDDAADQVATKQLAAWQKAKTLINMKTTAPPTLVLDAELTTEDAIILDFDGDFILVQTKSSADPPVYSNILVDRDTIVFIYGKAAVTAVAITA
eukprot:TRINITY_DN10481_c0_g1_i1.p1 TRINITY_DN10481_c0_g1~~TRINITY_DN10481_c0_g1_i1.p1  ORF type:complete len:236 (+),score=65.18 TRINITY_DN10481_c0_g1_i1:31-738(+)